MDLASVEVRFEDLSVNVEVAVGARGEPTVLNFFRNMLEVKASFCLPGTNSQRCMSCIL